MSEEIEREIERLAQLFDSGHTIMRADPARLIKLAADELELRRAQEGLFRSFALAGEVPPS